MSQTEKAGLDPAFWATFPAFKDEGVAKAVEGLQAWAISQEEDEAQAIQGVSVEYTHLFVGPPAPAAPPWETMNRAEGVSVGFGQPTFAMQDILRKMGLGVSNENNQYADHMGLELLTLSEMLRRVEQGQMQEEEMRSFAAEHPTDWIGTLYTKVQDAAPGGYFDHLLTLSKALLELIC